MPLPPASPTANAASKPRPAPFRCGAIPPAERRRLLLEAAEQMLLREAKFIAAMAAETGATAHWAGFNVHLAADILREAAALTTQIEGQ